MPIDDALKEIRRNEEETNLELVNLLIRIEGVRGAPAEGTSKIKYLKEALEIIKGIKVEIDECYLLDFGFGELQDILQAKRKPAAKFAAAFTEADFIFCYLVGCIEDRNRLINQLFYPAKGHDYDWGLTAKGNRECNAKDASEIINKYNSYLQVPAGCFKPIRLPTDLLHGCIYNTSLFQYFG